MRAVVLSLMAFLAWSGAAVADGPSHGLSLYGELKYPPDFKHYDYVNPDAPKGGTVKYDAIGTFDTLNPFTLKGQPAAGSLAIYDTLLAAAPDDPVAAYALIAESVEVAPDRRSVLYTLRKEARFHDGTPITPEDVVWTFDTLKTKGHPRYRLYYADVVKAETEGERGVRFTFKSDDNHELPQIVGEMPVLPKKYWEAHDFEKTTLDPPLGSGPYKIDAVDPGRAVTLRRVPDYWGKDLPVNVGRFNVDVIRYDYYRDQTIALEAFKAGQYDIRVENVAKNWAIGYDGPALEQGLIKKETIPNKLPEGMQAFVFNTRPGHRFEDVRVRQALGYLFDFEWTNKNLFYGAYTRTESYFSNSDLASSGVPQGGELAILQPFKGAIPDSIFTAPFTLPKTDGSGNIRDNLRAALRLFAAAGWSVKNGQLVNGDGKQFAFEFLLAQPEFERIVLPFGQNLERAGIKMNVRLVDPAQYENRMRQFDFDLAVGGWGESLSPGNEQRDYWGSAAADEPGSGNYAGIKDKAVDALVDKVIHATGRDDLIASTHALDRVLLAGYYVIPNWHITSFRVAHWDKFGLTKTFPPYALDLDSWWVIPGREGDIEAKKQQVQTK